MKRHVKYFLASAVVGLAGLGALGYEYKRPTSDYLYSIAFPASLALFAGSVALAGKGGYAQDEAIVEEFTKEDVKRSDRRMEKYVESSAGLQEVMYASDEYSPASYKENVHPKLQRLAKRRYRYMNPKTIRNYTRH